MEKDLFDRYHTYPEHIGNPIVLDQFGEEEGHEGHNQDHHISPEMFLPLIIQRKKQEDKQRLLEVREALGNL